MQEFVDSSVYCQNFITNRKNCVLVDDENTKDRKTHWFSIESTQKHV